MKGRYSTLIWLGLILLIVFVICFFSRSERIRTYKEDIQRRRDSLRRQITNKESIVVFLVAELNKLRNLNDELLKRALTLEIVKQYFIDLQYIKAGFEPEMIVVIENSLKSEKEKLDKLRKEYKLLELRG